MWGVADGVEPLHRDCQGDEDSGGQGGVVQAVQNRHHLAEQCSLQIQIILWPL